jgi:hypothetical protein
MADNHNSFTHNKLLAEILSTAFSVICSLKKGMEKKSVDYPNSLMVLVSTLTWVRLFFGTGVPFFGGIMKHPFVAIFSIFVVTATSLFANDEIQEIIIQPDDVHVPAGFDSNDKIIEIFFTGDLGNSCDRHPFGEATIKGGKIYITMKAQRLSGGDGGCLQVLSPYLVRVPLGQLRPGNYEILVNKGTPNEISSRLIVEKPSSPNIDNFSYANVLSATKAKNKNALILKGSHPNGCTEMASLEVVANAAGNTFAILPIVEQFGGPCTLIMKPFEIEVPIPDNMQDDVVVFHIRKNNGNALNIRW